MTLWEQAVKIFHSNVIPGHLHQGSKMVTDQMASSDFHGWTDYGSDPANSWSTTTFIVDSYMPTMLQLKCFKLQVVTRGIWSSISTQIHGHIAGLLTWLDNTSAKLLSNSPFLRVSYQRQSCQAEISVRKVQTGRNPLYRVPGQPRRPGAHTCHLSRQAGRGRGREGERETAHFRTS